VQEGQVWEAAMFARQHKLSKLTAILDYNRLQLDGPTAEIIDLEPVLDKWRAFGWRAVEIDGHDISEIVEALDDAGNHDESPTMIIARTVKGKGVSFMENNNDFHGMAPTDDELALAIEELS
ncbi:MAG: transketolase, partial [Pirellulaceae bacterium]|nr:transketolase [Pirellulaceae bacterium]